MTDFSNDPYTKGFNDGLETALSIANNHRDEFETKIKNAIEKNTYKISS